MVNTWSPGFVWFGGEWDGGALAVIDRSGGVRVGPCLAVRTTLFGGGSQVFLAGVARSQVALTGGVCSSPVGVKRPHISQEQAARRAVVQQPECGKHSAQPKYPSVELNWARSRTQLQLLYSQIPLSPLKFLTVSSPINPIPRKSHRVPLALSSPIQLHRVSLVPTAGVAFPTRFHWPQRSRSARPRQHPASTPRRILPVNWPGFGRSLAGRGRETVGHPVVIFPLPGKHHGSCSPQHRNKH